MKDDIDRVLISRQQIADRVRELARQITADAAGLRRAQPSRGGDMTIVAIMTGALVFCSDLIREIPISMKMGLIMVSSYPGASIRAQSAQVLGRHLGDIRGHQVLVVDDILDSGGTISQVVPMLRDLGAADVRSCLLLRKDRPSARKVHADYVGFDIPDEFVVGYGLDFNGLYRNLPEIVTLKPAVYQSAGVADGASAAEGTAAAGRAAAAEVAATSSTVASPGSQAAVRTAD
jgi:hypoxanthine phosphoribosyltransferase